jgi:hypothetical protein
MWKGFNRWIWSPLGHILRVRTLLQLLGLTSPLDIVWRSIVAAVILILPTNWARIKSYPGPLIAFLLIIAFSLIFLALNKIQPAHARQQSPNQPATGPSGHEPQWMSFGLDKIVAGLKVELYSSERWRILSLQLSQWTPDIWKGCSASVVNVKRWSSVQQSFVSIKDKNVEVPLCGPTDLYPELPGLYSLIQQRDGDKFTIDGYRVHVGYQGEGIYQLDIRVSSGQQFWTGMICVEVKNGITPLGIPCPVPK